MQSFTVEPGLSTEGPVVRLASEGAHFLHPAAAAALALDLVSASAIARYEAALAGVLRERADDGEDGATVDAFASEVIAAVRGRLGNDSGPGPVTPEPDQAS